MDEGDAAIVPIRLKSTGAEDKMSESRRPERPN